VTFRTFVISKTLPNSLPTGSCLGTAKPGTRVWAAGRRRCRSAFMLSLGGKCPYYACVPTSIMVDFAGTLVKAGQIPTLDGARTTADEPATTALGRRAAAVR